ASPHVAGVAALLLARTPSLTVSALRARLTTYAVGPATQYGVGLVNAYNSLTQTHGPPTQVFALLYSAVSGAVVQAVSTDPGGGFAFTRVEDGKYFVYGAGDESGDKLVGVRVRTRGSHGDRPVRRGAEPAPPGRRLHRPVPPQLLLAPDALAQSGYVLRRRRRTVQRVAVSAAGPGRTVMPTARRTECRW